MEEENSTVRKRVTTLYSSDGQGSGDGAEAAPPETPPPPLIKEGRTTELVVREIAESMFGSMCVGFEENIITEENMECAVGNLAAASMNPTHSLAQTHAYAHSSEAIKSSIRKLLQDVLKRSNNGEVGNMLTAISQCNSSATTI
jgi:hypothetical protein